MKAQNPLPLPKVRVPAAKGAHPRMNLGKYLHPPKGSLTTHLKALKAKGAFRRLPRGAGID